MTEPRAPHDDSPEFLDLVYEWTQRAPWLAISCALHVIVFLVLAVVPWSLLERDEETVIIAEIAPAQEEVFQPEEDEIVPPVEIPVPVESTEVVETTELDPIDDETFDEADLETDEARSPSPFDALANATELGIGGSAGGDDGSGIGARLRRKGRRPGPHDRETTLALKWLAAHQGADGGWDCDGFSERCGRIGAGVCGDPGESVHDVGVTGLALLAFLGAGHTTRHGEFSRTVALGVRWLEAHQDPDSGLIGERVGSAYLYDHAIATLALCEAYYFSRTPIHRRAAQEAVHYVSRARNPYGAWRYDCPPIGDNDTSVTGWMVFALKSAQEAGLDVDPRAFQGALSFLDEVTDPATGRTGYDSVGSASSRIPGVNDQFPTEGTEAMTAVALLSRIFVEKDASSDELLEKQADLLRHALPETGNRDVYYWYYGTYAMYQMGGRHWRDWSRALEPVLLESQRRDGDFAGSWDPVGPWGFSGGRVYSTALMALCLQVQHRYSRVLGAR